MRRAARVDENQADLVAYLRKRGATVKSLAAVGQGFPDLAVGYKGINLLVEIKNPSQSNTVQKLKPQQVDVHENWQGKIDIVKTEADIDGILSDIDFVVDLADSLPVRD